MPTPCLFVSDLHGQPDRYEKLWNAIAVRPPAGVFLGGDLLPSGMASLAGASSPTEFIQDFLAAGFQRLRRSLGERYPRVFLIPGNDDARIDAEALDGPAADGLWESMHGRAEPFHGYRVLGYAFVPPTPFLLKDWERYDVSRYVPPGGVSPEEGWRTVPCPEREIRYSTIREDLDRLAGEGSLDDAILLFHGPPHETALDRVDTGGRMIDHVPLDTHVGSIALRRFIQSRQPLLGLHGHVHESARLSGSWRDRIGRTHLLGAAHDGPELALVRFDPGRLEAATRELL